MADIRLKTTNNTEIKALEQSGSEYQIHYAVRSKQEATYLSKLPVTKTTVYSKDRGERLHVEQVIPQPRNGKDFEAVI
jgi:hypothetical protein